MGNRMVERLMEGGERLRLWSGGGGLCGGRCDDDSVMGTVKPFYPFCLYLSYCLSICVSTCLSHCDSLSVSVSPSFYLTLCQPLCVCTCLSHFTLLLCLRPSLCLSVCVYACPSHCPSLYRNVCRRGKWRNRRMHICNESYSDAHGDFIQ